MYYKVFISTAGIGSRIHPISKINKSLLPIKGKAAITRIINQFPIDIEIVIALGYQKETVKDFLKISFPKRKFKFVIIDKFYGKGSGPGYTLLKCKKFLQCPFIYSSCDTIVSEKIKLTNLDKNEYIFSRRSVTVKPKGISSRILNPAIDFFDIVKIGCCPVIKRISSVAF